jgi:uncharacterized protein YraI
MTPTDSAERKCRVVRDYQAQFSDPISVEAHEPFAVSERSEPWEDNPEWMWVWCTDQRGKSGWVPKNIIQMEADGKTGTTQAAYNARELTVNAGQELIVEQEESGWFWCRDQQGEHGWVPISHVMEL